VIMAMRIKHRLSDALRDFVDRGGLILGICNGFQVLVNLGLLPLFDPPELRREVALIGNDCGNFRDQWVKLAINRASSCVFTRGMDTIDLPVRHGEGKFYAVPGVIRRLEAQNQVIMRYAAPEGVPAQGAFPHNPNGSVADIAGICDPTGRIAGLMPHPEAYNHVTNHPDWTLWKEQCRRDGTELPEEGMGIQLFRNAVELFS
jgi:phosphoribosylformylglycinamidine synthase subunit PurQ / glutaminase